MPKYSRYLYQILFSYSKVLTDRMEGCIDCPLPPPEDHICRRDVANEDVLILAQRHSGHSCDYALTVKSIVVWEGN